MTGSGSLRAVGGRHELRMERQLNHPREKVWRAVTDVFGPRHQHSNPHLERPGGYTMEPCVA